jgi:AcrR family transcriptional regulator
MPRTGLKPQEIQDRAVAHATERMRRDGFQKVRLVDVARDVGVSHAALYSHFADKAALLDAVSARWLQAIDAAQDKYIQSRRDPVEKITGWCLRLHQAKREKVRLDPELYKSFDAAADLGKPFIREHMGNVARQMATLVRAAMAAGKLRRGDPARVAAIILSASAAFHHPKMVVQFLHEDREPLLRQTLDAVLKGLQ